jgi:hypothetical protein
VPRPSASGALKKGSKAPNPLREAAFELFASGKTYEEITALLKVAKSTLCRWRDDGDWNTRLRKVQDLYQAKLSERLAGRRASADAAAILKLLDTREVLVDALKERANELEPGQIPAALRAVQDSLSKISPNMGGVDDEDAREEVDGFVAIPVDNSVEPPDGA